jgi:hypothetical protein
VVAVRELIYLPTYLPRERYPNSHEGENGPFPRGTLAWYRSSSSSFIGSMQFTFGLDETRPARRANKQAKAFGRHR